MLSKSTNDTSVNKSEKIIQNDFKSLIENLDNKMPKNINIDDLENGDSLIHTINQDEQSHQESKDNFNIHYIDKKNIILDFIITKNEDKNDVKDTYEIKNIDDRTYLCNGRDQLSNSTICISRECYHINKKFKLQNNMLLYYLRKKEEKDKILILLIIEKEKNEDKDKIVKNKNIFYMSDSKFDIIVKPYYFSLKTPQIGENFSSYLLNKNGKEEIILLFWCENKIYLYKIQNIYDDNFSVNFNYTFKLDFVPKFICPLKTVKENKEKLLKEENEIFYTDYFLVITKGKSKLCKCIDEKRALFICDVENEYKGYKGNDDIKSIIEKNIIQVEQLDNDLISIHFKNGQNKEIALFNLYCKDFIYQYYYENWRAIFFYKLKKIKLLPLKNLENTIEFLDNITPNESGKSSNVMEIEDYIEQPHNTNIFNIGTNLNNFIKMNLVNQINPINEIKISNYFVELKAGEAIFYEQNKNIPISKKTYQKSEIFELDKSKKIVLIILIKTIDEIDNISLYCLDIINYPGQNSLSEFHYSIPSIKDYSFYTLEKNNKKEIIMLFCCEKEIHSIKLKFNISNYKMDDCERTKDNYIFNDELTSICSIKNTKFTDNMPEKYISYYTEYFLVSIKTNIKLFKCDGKGKIIFISDIEFEKENNDIFIKNIKQLDNGIITIHLSNNKIFKSYLSLKDNAFIRNIIINFNKMLYYLEDITLDNKEKNNLVNEFNEYLEHSGIETDYTLNDKNQALENNNCQNSNVDIDINAYDLHNNLLLKIICQDFTIENQKSEYSLEFTPQGVYLKIINEIYEQNKVSDESYQMGKVIEIENGKVLAILIKNKDKETNILLCCLDLIHKTNSFVFESKIPPIKDYSLHILDKNEKKQLIILLCCEFKILMLQFELNRSNSKEYEFKLKVKKEYTKFNATSICPLRAFRKDDELPVKNRVLSEYFLASNETNIKMFKYNEEGDIICIYDVKFEDQMIQKFVERNHIKRIEQLDDGIISVILNKIKIYCYLFLNEPN